MTPDDDKPLSPQEIALYRSQASGGNPPSLGIIRRFVLTIRKTFSASPSKVEKVSKTRNSKPKPDENQIDFF